MAQGWIKLHRNLLDNPLWLADEFTKGQAWVDILLRINHQDNKVMVGNTPIEVKAGQTLWSTKDMSERWKWSRKKVVNFLNMLKKEHQLDFESTTKYTVLTVENWALYQDENEKGTTKDEKGNNKGTSKAHQRNTNKNDKNDNKNKYADYVSMTEEEYQKLITEYGQVLISNKITDLNLWKGSKGKSTKSDYMTILAWIRKDNAKPNVASFQKEPICIPNAGARKEYRGGNY